jgi:hypothetical protein
MVLKVLWKVAIPVSRGVFFMPSVKKGILLRYGHIPSVRYYVNRALQSNLSMQILYSFNQLSVQQKADYLIQHGYYILSKHYQDVSVHLYSLHTFYVEVWMYQGNLNQINSFKAEKAMSRYQSLRAVAA